MVVKLNGKWKILKGLVENLQSLKNLIESLEKIVKTSKEIKECIKNFNRCGSLVEIFEKKLESLLKILKIMVVYFKNSIDQFSIGLKIQLINFNMVV